MEVSRQVQSTGAYATHGAPFRKYTLELYDRPSAPLELKIRMLRAEVLETMVYGCVTWSPRACHYDTLRRAHHSFLTRCIDWRKNIRTDHPISYLDTLIKTESESIEAIISRRRILFAGFVAWTTSEVSVSTPTSGRLQPRTRGNRARRQNKGRSV